MMKSLICLSLIILPLFTVVASEKVIGWRVIPVTGPTVASVAKFSIDEHNRLKKDNLVLVKFDDAREQVDAGVKQYGLEIIARKRDTKGPNKYYVSLVYHKPGHTMTLEHFHFAYEK
ncbi:unnamed protein product [Cochlearia groenlandica]